MYSTNFENYLPTSKVLSPVFYLRFNMTGAEECANSTTEPSNPLFHHFLSPNEFKQKFGPSESELSLVESWLSGNGINDYARYGAFGLTFNATLGTTSSMLGTRIANYSIDGNTFFRNITTVTFPARISGIVQAIDGLNNFKGGLITSTQDLPGPGGTLTSATPGDITSAFHINQLLSDGYNGLGFTAAVIGFPEESFHPSDVNYFWHYYDIGYIDSAYNWLYPYVAKKIIGGGGTAGFDSTYRSNSKEETLDTEWLGVIASGKHSCCCL